MSAQATKTPAETTTYNTAAYAAWFNQGLERVFEVSKSSLDLAVEQNAKVLASFEKALRASPLPNLFLFDLAGSAFESYVALQKSLLGLAVEQYAASIAAAQEYSFGAGKSKGRIGTPIEQPVHRTVATQNSVPNSIAEQAKAEDKNMQQPGAAVETVTDSFERGMDAVIAAQEEILDPSTKSVKTSKTKA
jgi:hypothetical protein